LNALIVIEMYMLHNSIQQKISFYWKAM